MYKNTSILKRFTNLTLMIKAHAETSRVFTVSESPCVGWVFLMSKMDHSGP